MTFHRVHGAFLWPPTHNSDCWNINIDFQNPWKCHSYVKGSGCRQASLYHSGQIEDLLSDVSNDSTADDSSSTSFEILELRQKHH
jgi:hypothetical protein